MITETISLAHPSHYRVFNAAKASHRLVTDRAQRDMRSEAGFRPTRVSVDVA